MNILVIRFRQMGDAIVATPLLASLRKSFPDARIDYVLNERLGPLFDGLPFIDNVISFSDDERHSPLRYLRKVRSVMRRGRYDAILDLRSTPNTLPFLLFSPRSKYRIGLRKGYTGLFYNHFVDPVDNGPMVDHDLEFMKPLAAEGELCYDRRLHLAVTDSERADARRRMTETGLDPDRPLMLAGVTTKCLEKEWDRRSMASVLSRFLDSHPEVQVLVNYAPGAEEERAREVVKMAGHSDRIFMEPCGRSMRELAAIASHCTFYFGNEGGARHVAHAMGCPSIVICAPGTPASVWIPQDGEITAVAVEPPADPDTVLDRLDDFYDNLPRN